MWREKAGRIGVAALLLCLALAGCSNERGKATQAARDFVEAAKASNSDAARALLTQKAREATAQFGNLPNFGWDPQSNVTVGDATLNGVEAVVPVTFEREGRRLDGSLKLRQETDQWRIYAVTGPLGPGGPPVTLDLEHVEDIGPTLRRAIEGASAEAMKATGEMFKAVGEGMKKAGEQIRDSPGRP